MGPKLGRPGFVCRVCFAAPCFLPRHQQQQRMHSSGSNSPHNLFSRRPPRRCNELVSAGAHARGLGRAPGKAQGRAPFVGQAGLIAPAVGTCTHPMRFAGIRVHTEELRAANCNNHAPTFGVHWHCAAIGRARSTASSLVEATLSCFCLQGSLWDCREAPCGTADACERRHMCAKTPSDADMWGSRRAPGGSVRSREEAAVYTRANNNIVSTRSVSESRLPLQNNDP